LKSLNDIYQQEQDWLEAIRSATRYEAVSGRSMIINVSHYYCELADQAVLQNDSKSAEKYLASALRVDDKAIRAYLCRAKIQAGNKKWQKAIDNYHHAIKADSSYIPVFIDDMAQCYMELSQTKELESFLLHLIGKYQGVSPILTLSNLYSSTQGMAFAAAFVEKQLKQRASVKGLNALIELKLSMLDSDEQEKSYFHVLKTLVDQLLLDKPRLRCRKCGFGAKAIHWQCPSCKNWGVVKPIYGLESE
ncbi:MAG: hypothetical protein L3J52_10620, partial [Proteobacteria bacterium]|nr:hypothetical protein [Pseudomonadota bacterium]